MASYGSLVAAFSGALAEHLAHGDPTILSNGFKNFLFMTWLLPYLVGAADMMNVRKWVVRRCRFISSHGSNGCKLTGKKKGNRRANITPVDGGGGSSEGDGSSLKQQQLTDPGVDDQGGGKAKKRGLSHRINSDYTSEHKRGLFILKTFQSLLPVVRKVVQEAAAHAQTVSVKQEKHEQKMDARKNMKTKEKTKKQTAKSTLGVTTADTTTTLTGAAHTSGGGASSVRASGGGKWSDGKGKEWFVGASTRVVKGTSRRGRDDDDDDNVDHTLLHVSSRNLLAAAETKTSTQNPLTNAPASSRRRKPMWDKKRDAAATLAAVEDLDTQLCSMIDAFSNGNDDSMSERQGGERWSSLTGNYLPLVWSHFIDAEAAARKLSEIAFPFTDVCYRKMSTAEKGVPGFLRKSFTKRHVLWSKPVTEGLRRVQEETRRAKVAAARAKGGKKGKEGNEAKEGTEGKEARGSLGRTVRAVRAVEHAHPNMKDIRCWREVIMAMLKPHTDFGWHGNNEEMSDAAKNQLKRSLSFARPKDGGGGGGGEGEGKDASLRGDDLIIEGEDLEENKETVLQICDGGGGDRGGNGRGEETKVDGGATEVRGTPAKHVTRHSAGWMLAANGNTASHNDPGGMIGVIQSAAATGDPVTMHFEREEVNDYDDDEAAAFAVGCPFRGGGAPVDMATGEFVEVWVPEEVLPQEELPQEEVSLSRIVGDNNGGRIGGIDGIDEKTVTAATTGNHHHHHQHPHHQHHQHGDDDESSELGDSDDTSMSSMSSTH